MERKEERQQTIVVWFIFVQSKRPQHVDHSWHTQKHRHRHKQAGLRCFIFLLSIGKDWWWLLLVSFFIIWNSRALRAIQSTISITSTYWLTAMPVILPHFHHPTPAQFHISWNFIPNLRRAAYYHLLLLLLLLLLRLLLSQGSLLMVFCVITTSIYPTGEMNLGINIFYWRKRFILVFN